MNCSVFHLSFYIFYLFVFLLFALKNFIKFYAPVLLQIFKTYNLILNFKELFSCNLLFFRIIYLFLRNNIFLIFSGDISRSFYIYLSSLLFSYFLKNLFLLCLSILLFILFYRFFSEVWRSWTVLLFFL